MDGAGLRRVTPDPNDTVTGSWSRDGRWIYFSSDRTGRLEIWRVPVAGGAEEQLTREGGMNPVESLDGRTLYYMREDGDFPLLARPTAGGEERTILGCVGTRAYAPDQDGLFYLGCLNSTIGDGSRYALRHWDARTGKDQLLATLDVGDSYAAVWGGLSVSPDGRTVLFPRATQSKDLMMIENFR